MILIIAGGFKIKKLYYERPPYHFWYELLEKILNLFTFHKTSLRKRIEKDTAGETGNITPKKSFGIKQ